MSYKNSRNIFCEYYRFPAIASALLLIIFMIVLVADSRREWKKYATDPDSPEVTPRILRTTVTAYPQETSFGPTARIENCRTCHDNLPEKCPKSVEYSTENTRCSGAESGCATCHGGRGESLSMATAGHLPENMAECEKWTKEHGWFRDFSVRDPIRQKSFSESGCLSCHENGYELPPSAAYPISPAEQMRRGFLLVQKYNCTGCHYIGRSGFPESAGASRRKISLAEVGLRMDQTAIRAYLKSPSMENPHAMMPEFFESAETFPEPQRREIENLETQRMERIARLLAGMRGENALSETNHSESISINTRFPDPQRGREIFILSGCAACHPRSDIGFSPNQFFVGPGLDLASRVMNKKTSHQWITSVVLNPSAHFSNSRMPQIDISKFDEKYPSENGDGIATLFHSKDDLVAFLLGTMESSPGFHPPENSSENVLEFNRKDVIKKSGMNETPEILMGEYGCTACHEIPGIPDRRIGPDLSEWGRKAEFLLDFGGHKSEDLWNNTINEEDSSLRMMMSQRRLDGFVIARLRDPRGVGTPIISNGYPPSKMGRFAAMTPSDRKDIATFIIGLKRIRNVSPRNASDEERRHAIVEGEEIFHQYGCLLCHAVIPEYRQFRETASENITKTFGFSERDIFRFPESIIDGDHHLSDFHSLTSVRTLLETRYPGEGSLLIEDRNVLSSAPAYGGDFADFLSHYLTNMDGKISVNVSIRREQLPPFLFRVGRRIQPSQLEYWLADPEPYRPISLIQMPRFPLSPAETRKLANYFVAAEMEWEQMYGSVSSGISPSFSLPANDEMVSVHKMDDMDMGSSFRESEAMINSNEFCGKCHSIGNPGRTAPDLRTAAKRLRPSALREWISAPERVRPLTTMPAFFPESQPESSEKIKKTAQYLIMISP